MWSILSRSVRSKSFAASDDGTASSDPNPLHQEQSSLRLHTSKPARTSTPANDSQPHLFETGAHSELVGKPSSTTPTAHPADVQPTSANPVPSRLRAPPTSVRNIFSQPVASPKTSSQSTSSFAQFARRSSLGDPNPFDLSTDTDIPPIPTGLSLANSAIEVVEGDTGPESMTITTLENAPLPMVPRVTMPRSTHTPTSFSKAYEQSRMSNVDQSTFFSVNKTTLSPLPPNLHVQPLVNAPSRTRSFFSTRAFPGSSSLTRILDPLGVDGSFLHAQSRTTEVFQMVPPHTQPPVLELSSSPPCAPLLPPNCIQETAPLPDEALIITLRTQLALQEELSGQYERELSSRDEQVVALQGKLALSAQHANERKALVQGWKKKVAELERAYRYFEEQAESKAEDSGTRTIPGGADGETLHSLQVRLAKLEREKHDAEHTLEALKAELGRDGHRQAVNAEIASWPGHETKLTTEAQHAHVTLEELTAKNSSLVRDKEQLTEVLARHKDELVLLKAEVEAQWKHTEDSSTQIAHLKKENAQMEEAKVLLEAEVHALEAKISSVELEWTEYENQRIKLETELQEALDARDDADQHRESLDALLQDEQARVEELEQALHDREDHITELIQEHQQALDSAAQLEENLRLRDGGESALRRRVRDAEAEAESALEELSRIKREHAQVLESKARELSTVLTREADARAQMQATLKERTNDDAGSSRVQDQTRALEEQVRGLRQQLQELQQGSADKDMKIARLAKERKQMRDDMENMNMAVDSKQQELEMYKRKQTARAMTTVNPSMGSRRQSSVLATPAESSRPSSALSNGSSATHSSSLASSASTARGAITLANGRRHNSTPANSLSTSSATVKKPTGPPSLKPAALTPTVRRASSSSSVAARLATARTPPSGLPSLTAGRRSVSVSSSVAGSERGLPSPTPSEKENFETPKAPRPKSAMAVPA